MIYLSGHELVENSDLQYQRNLLKNSVSILVDKDHRHSVSTMTNMFNIFPLDGSLNEGEKVTISVQDIAVKGNDHISIGLWTTDISPFDTNGGRNDFYSGSITLTITKSVNNPGIAIWAGSANTATSETSSVMLKKVMVQRGSTSTMWLPAPEDLGLATQSELDDLKAQIEQLKSK